MRGTRPRLTRTSIPEGASNVKGTAWGADFPLRGAAYIPGEDHPSPDAVGGKMINGGVLRRGLIKVCYTSTERKEGSYADIRRAT